MFFGGSGSGEGGIMVDMSREVKFCINSKKNGGGHVEWGAQDGFEQRIEVLEKIHNFFFFFFFFWGVGGGLVESGWGLGEVRVDVNEVLKFL